MFDPNVQIYERTVASELGKLQLDKLESDWTKDVIENDFLQYQDLPLSYEELLEECNISARFKNVKEAILQWLELNKKTVETGEDSSSHVRQSLGSSQTSENLSACNGPQHTNNGAIFWGFLFQKENVNIDNLLALIGFIIDRGSTLASNRQERKQCFEAANMYLTMICIPGSMAFRVYHQMLFMKTIQLIQLYVQASKHQKTKTHIPSKKSQRQPIPEVEEEEEEAPNREEEIAAIEKALPNYMEALTLVAQHLSFKRYPSILKETVELMLPVISLNKGTISLKALEIVQHFCQPLHGDAIQIVHHVFVHILPHLTLDPTEKDLNNRNLIALKDVSFSLVRSFISKFGEKIYPLVQGLIKHVCVDVVDRSEYRHRTAQTALDLLQLIPEEHHQGIIRWFLLLAHAEQAFLRLFSMEILSLLLQNGRIDMLTFAVIFGQCSDASATVRAKALSILGECLESNNQSIIEMLNIIFDENPERQVIEEREEEEEENDILELLQGEEPIAMTPALLPKASDIMNLLKERAVDDKVHVRKNALQLLLSVARRHDRYLNKDLVKLFGNACRDVALLIRRHMVQMLTELVSENPQNDIVLNAWAHSVLPLVLDGETRVQEKALECADQLILRSLISSDNQLGWTILDVIIDQGLDTYLGKAVEMWSRQQQIPGQLLRILLSNTEQRCQAAMTLIAIIARHMSIENNVKKFAIDYLQENIGSKDPDTIYCVQQVYKVIGASLPKMTKEQVKTIRALSGRFVANFQLPTNLIATACDMAVFCIQQEIEDENAARMEAAEWAATILLSCGEFLSNHLRKQENVCFEEEEQLARRIITLGCVALHSPHEVNKRHFLMLQHAAFQPESGVDAPIPFSQPQSKPTRQLPPRLQAASIISLGKLSVQHEEMAKQLIPGLGRLLETTPHDAVRNNIVCILCDMVVRYATAIDPVMPQVTACLRDPTPSVRKQTLVLLIHLLQEDYLKIRGTFFFRILQLACDDDEGLRDLALFYITQRLLHRQPTIIQQHFIECVFHFNDYKGHPTYNKFALTDRERKLFSISGTQYARRRFQIYQFMLQNLDDEARFQLTFRLTRDVLHGVVEEVMSLQNASTEAVLKDALVILSSEDIKLASLSAQTDDDPVDKEDIAQAIVQSTKKAIIAQVVKRNVIENIVPIVVALKRKLATNKSPLMGNLMQFLRELMKDYKNEIQEILAEDRQLMAEIDFDLKRFEQQEKEDANLQTGNRTDRSVPPPELIAPNIETARLQQADRRSLMSKKLLQPPEVGESSVTQKNVNVEEPEDEVVASKTIENDPASNGQQEIQAAALEDPADSEEFPVPNAPRQEEMQDDDQVCQDEINGDDSLPPLESSRRRKPPPKRNSVRRHHLRNISTPIRNIPTDEVSFQIQDLDLSEIPQLDTRKRKRL